MEVSEVKVREYTRRIMLSRMRILCDNGFYGLLLMHIKMNIGQEHETAWTDGMDRIYLNPEFLERISDRELDYVLMHLVLHIILQHMGRKGNFEEEYFDLAADIVVNSNILRSCGGDESFISLRAYGGVQPNAAPNGKEGWCYTLEEIYGMLRGKVAAESQGGKKGEKVHEENKGEQEKNDGEEDSRGGKDGQEGKDDQEDGRKVKSGQETAEGREKNGKKENETDQDNKLQRSGKQGWDYHNKSDENFGVDESQKQLQMQVWQGRIGQAAQVVKMRATRKDRGHIPAFVERYLDELQNPRIDWRTVLDEFIQEEINDYSFCPPDRRFVDSPFFLPDFNEKDDRVEKILFMIDTSGSMSDEEITQCYSEIKGAIDQFGGKLEGWLGFFDAVIVEPQPFADEEEFRAIRPKGGGGTSFNIIFEYVREYMWEDLPVSIVVLTDGYAPFPDQKAAMDIPVLWIINNEDVMPPWGKVARITENS